MAKIRKIVKYAPCGKCGRECLRDDMHSINVKLYTPTDEQHKVQIRACQACRDELIAMMIEMEWDNADMYSKEVDVSDDIPIAV